MATSKAKKVKNKGAFGKAPAKSKADKRKAKK